MIVACIATLCGGWPAGVVASENVRFGSGAAVPGSKLATAIGSKADILDLASHGAGERPKEVRLCIIADMLQTRLDRP